MANAIMKYSQAKPETAQYYNNPDFIKISDKKSSVIRFWGIIPANIF